MRYCRRRPRRTPAGLAANASLTSFRVCGVGLDRIRPFAFPLRAARLVLRIPDAAGCAPSVFGIEQDIAPGVANGRGRIFLRIAECQQRLGLDKPVGTVLRFMAVSSADEPAPSSQYGVQSPRNSGSCAPYFSSNARKASLVVAMMNFGYAYFAFPVADEVGDGAVGHVVIGVGRPNEGT